MAWKTIILQRLGVGYAHRLDVLRKLSIDPSATRGLLYFRFIALTPYLQQLSLKGSFQNENYKDCRFETYSVTYYCSVYQVCFFSLFSFFFSKNIQ